MASSRPSPDLRDRIAEFVYRCGRVLAVPISRNHELLKRAHQMAITTSEAGTTESFRLLPPELELDAVAARARPLFLEDRCSYMTGLASLRRVVKDSHCEHSSDYVEAIRDLHTGWNEVKARAVRRYLTAQRMVDDPNGSSSWSDSELADAWLNGDLIHADEGRQHIATRKERLVAGWDHHSDIIQLAHTSVQFVGGFNQHLKLELPTWAFETEDHPHGMVSTGVSLGVWLAPAPQTTPDPAEHARTLSTTLRDLRPPDSEYKPFTTKPGDMQWVEIHPW